VTWSRYYDAVAGAEPRPTLLLALERFDSEGPAPGGDRLGVDLGCGDGRDTAELLRRGWRVVAVDSELEAFERLRGRPEAAAADGMLELVAAPFETVAWAAADLVNASFSLPLCAPADFAVVWERIMESLRPGGRFSGQLFGERDGWAPDPGLTFLSGRQAERLFGEFELERFDEVEDDGETRRGEWKHWHVFHVVARKRWGRSGLSGYVAKPRSLFWSASQAMPRTHRRTRSENERATPA
jgi:tellurite methyltransferase